MSKITAFFTELMRKYLPDPFVFAILLTLLTMVLAFAVESRPVNLVVEDWGKGFWSLLAFTTQMAVILVMGYVLAAAPLVNRFLDRIASHVHTPRQAIIVATIVGCVGSYLNWGFGLVIGGIMARKLALKVKGVHYPLIIASAYTGFTMYSLGFSATIPVLISTKGHSFESTMGIIPLTETIFSWPGLGRWLINAIRQQDYAAISAGVMVIGALVIIVNVISDILGAMANPLKHKEWYALR